jgi:hypothetical protein
MVGQRFARLLVQEMVKHASGRTCCLCRCDCGNFTTVETSNIRRGLTRSCGCLRSETAGKSTVRHGMSRTREHSSWKSMKQRCCNPQSPFYHRYGARGITICKRWEDFENFYADMGPKPIGMSLDRIDNDKGYSPENCRWATAQQQARNRSNNTILTIDGQSRTISEWCDLNGIKRTTVIQRIRSGADIVSALTRPIEAMS